MKQNTFFDRSNNRKVSLQRIYKQMFCVLATNVLQRRKHITVVITIFYTTRIIYFTTLKMFFRLY